METYAVDNDEEHQATLLFLAALINRAGGEVFVSGDELVETLGRSAVRFVKNYKEDSDEPIGVTLTTLHQDDALAIYKEMNVDEE